MKAHIKLGFDGGQQGCTGHGRCAVMAGELYEVDDNGYNLRRGSTFDVPPGMEEAARYGAKVCPERAIVIEE
ncbi:ferredoxin [Streptomyces sp. NPDC005336]|uniref:ferredoxin n=1 Tax=Streptomyces sp. NPDC005336 TaxID=3157035 RepID=UPI0033B4FC93